MYTGKNFKSKAELKRALAAGEKVTVYAPGLGEVPENGWTDLCGPHYPQAHRWYCRGRMENGYLVEIK